MDARKPPRTYFPKVRARTKRRDSDAAVVSVLVAERGIRVIERRPAPEEESFSDLSLVVEYRKRKRGR